MCVCKLRNGGWNDTDMWQWWSIWTETNETILEKMNDCNNNDILINSLNANNNNLTEYIPAFILNDSIVTKTNTISDWSRAIDYTERLSPCYIYQSFSSLSQICSQVICACFHLLRFFFFNDFCFEIR